MNHCVRSGSKKASESVSQWAMQTTRVHLSDQSARPKASQSDRIVSQTESESVTQKEESARLETRYFVSEFCQEESKSHRQWGQAMGSESLHQWVWPGRKRVTPSVSEVRQKGASHSVSQRGCHQSVTSGRRERVIPSVSEIRQRGVSHSVS